MSHGETTFSLLETMRWENGIPLLDRHMKRLGSSARSLGFRFDETRIRAEIKRHCRALAEDSAYRLRLTLSEDGEVALTSSELDPQKKAFEEAGVHPEPFDINHVLRGFKTTRREMYEVPYRQATELGFDEALLVDDDGQLIEGTRTNVWVLKEGVWRTPPLSSGCLEGVYRAHLLETQTETREEVLHIQDLETAEQVALSNAVHGLVPIRVVLKA